jgi:hypothetical protein
MASVHRTVRPDKARAVRVFTSPDYWAGSPARSPGEPGIPAVVEITVGDNTTDYFTRRLHSDYGLAFELVRDTPDDPAVYHVILTEDGRQCDCKGFCAHGHCKHADAIHTLVQLGKV